MPGRRDLLRGTLSEFVAMTLFVFFGCGAAASNAHFSDGDWDPASVTVIALQFGLAITVLVYATAHTSGGHVNAAVTLGLTVSGKCHPIRGAAYFIAQMLGSIAGAAIRSELPGDGGARKRRRLLSPTRRTAIHLLRYASAMMHPTARGVLYLLLSLTLL